MLCKSCNQPLIQIEFSRHSRLVCDNDRCKLFREGQGAIEKEATEPEESGTISFITPRWLRPSYSAYNEERRQNYRLLRNLGVPSVETRGLTSRKQTRIYLEQNGYRRE